MVTRVAATLGGVPPTDLLPPARPGVTTVLFDLDGTISDSAGGILGSLRDAFAEHGIPWMAPEREAEILGPTLRVSLPPHVGEDRLDAVIASYRRRYSGDKRMLDTTVFPGVADLLDELVGRGVRLAVATSKPEPHAREILDHLGLADRFEVITGDTLDGGRPTKAAVVGEALARLGSPPAATVLMVGDRHHDVEGSRVHGVECVGVLWGYGSREELAAAGAWAICTAPAEVSALVAAP